MVCTYHHDLPLSNSRLESLGLSRPDIYTGAEAIAAYAVLGERGGFCLLPADNTLVSEALGARLIMDGSECGPRLARPAYEEPGQLLDSWRDREFPVLPRLFATAQACRLLSEEGRQVLFQADGALTHLFNLMPAPQAFAAISGKMKAPVLELISRALDFTVDYLFEFGAAGISYADACAQEDIIGPARAQELAEAFSLPFLSRFRIKYPEAMIFLCSETARSIRKVNAVGIAELGAVVSCWGAGSESSVVD